jgi:hypothetical protein
MASTGPYRALTGGLHGTLILRYHNKRSKHMAYTESPESKLGRHYDLCREATELGYDFPGYIKALEAQVNFKRKEQAVRVAAIALLRDGLGRTIDPENYDENKIVEETGLPRGQASVSLVRREMRRLRLTHRSSSNTESLEL